MADVANHVSLSIAVDSVGLARAGFGVPLFLSPAAAAVFGASEYTREYGSAAEVASDFTTDDCVEQRVANAVFAQNPAPKKFKIGKQSLKPTRVYTLTPVAANSTVYRLRLVGPGWDVDVSYTSDADATATEICDGLRTAIATAFASITENFTTGGTSTLTLTANAAGDWFAVEVGDITQWTLSGTHSDPGVATDLAAIALRDNDWYCLLMADPGNASVLAAAAWVQSNKKIMLAEVSEPAAVTTAVGNSDTLDDLHTLGYTRVAGCYHHAPDQFFSAAWAGKVLPSNPGSESWKFHKLVGVETTNLTSTQRTNLTNRKANTVETVYGYPFTVEGTTADGGFLDTTRGIDWLDDDMSKAVLEVKLKAAAAGGKVPYTDDGIATIVGAVRGSLARGVKRGVLVAGSTTVTAPLLADIDAADKAARRLPDVKFTATLAGAVHKTVIDGVVSV